MTLELTIKNEVYEFNFGMGFMREINKCAAMEVPDVKDKEKNVGLYYMIMNLMDGDLEALVDVLTAANKGFTPRVTRDLLDDYIDNDETDVDGLFAQVMDFLSKANATKGTVMRAKKAYEAYDQTNTEA